MCVAVVVDSKELIPRDDLKAMHEANDDGAGIAWCKDNLVHYRKGMTWQEINELQALLPRPFFMHFRIATAGGKIPELTHPFPLGMQAFTDDLVGSAPGVLMHNGTWRDYRKWVPEGINANLVSDTQVAAYVAETFEDILTEVSWSTAIMRAAGMDRVDITLRGRWNEYEGNQYSNLIWQSRKRPYVSYSHQYAGQYAGPYNSNWEDYRKRFDDTFNSSRTRTQPMTHQNASKGDKGKIKVANAHKKGRKKSTDEVVASQAWGDEELFTKRALERAGDRLLGEGPSVICSYCNREITEIPCICTKCPEPKCGSRETSELSDDWFVCEACFVCFTPEGPTDRDQSEVLSDEELESMILSDEARDLEDLVLSGDTPLDAAQINEYIRQQGVKINPVED